MNRLKELRKEKKLTQQELADYMQVTRRGYQKWENGESQIKPDKAQRLAEFFNVSVGYLLGYDTETLTTKQQLYVQKLKELDSKRESKNINEQITELENILPTSDKGRLKFEQFLSDDKITEYEKKVYEKYQDMEKLKNIDFSSLELSTLSISREELKQFSADIFAEIEIANFFTSLTYLTDLELPALIYFSALKKDTQKSLLDILKTLAENSD